MQADHHSSLNGLNTQNGTAETFVINVTSGLSTSDPINITGDATDIYILRWDDDANLSNGYDGQVKFRVAEVLFRWVG